MVHPFARPQEPMTEVVNDPCQHAFALMGDETVFGVHLTQYHCDKHRYQVVLRLGFVDPDQAEEFARQRQNHPDATFIFCNGETDAEKFSIPALGALNTRWGDAKDARVHGNVFYGFRPPKVVPPDEHWFPWNLEDTIPMIANVELRVLRVVLYRPFSLQDIAPPKATYLIFGEGNEAHMTNIQTGRLLSGPGEMPVFGLDVDHIMSLEAAPEWLSSDMLEAGTVVTLPAIDRYDDEGDLVIQESPPFDPQDRFFCLYRGMQPPRPLIAGPMWFWSGEVCNSPELVDITPGMSMMITMMPRRYWR